MIKHTNDRADRSVDFIFVLKHELPVHISLAIMNGTVRTGNKSELANVMTKYIYCRAVANGPVGPAMAGPIIEPVILIFL